MALSILRSRLLAERAWPGPARFERIVLAALVVAVALHGLGLGLFPLWDPSEGRYVAIAQSMTRSGEWV
jgi:4-amino-4-deoxy-L-arabinose transferase-like glycosyltransferase